MFHKEVIPWEAINIIATNAYTGQGLNAGLVTKPREEKTQRPARNSRRSNLDGAVVKRCVFTIARPVL